MPRSFWLRLLGSVQHFTTFSTPNNVLMVLEGEKKIIRKTYFPKGKLPSDLKFPNPGTPKGAANNISDSPSLSEITLQLD